jgi:ABC-type multidrug transport system fused ATPase/permease subunit
MAQDTSRLGDLKVGISLLWRVVLRYKSIAAMSIFGALIWMAMVIAVPYLVGRVIDTVVSDAAMAGVWPLLGLIVVAGAIQAVGISLRRYFGFKMSYRAEADLRNDIFTHIQRMAFSFHDVTSTGELMARASSDLGQLRLILAMAPITSANLVMFFVVTIVLVIIDPVLGLTGVGHRGGQELWAGVPAAAAVGWQGRDDLRRRDGNGEAARDLPATLRDHPRPRDGRRPCRWWNQGHRWLDHVR